MNRRELLTLAAGSSTAILLSDPVAATDSAHTTDQSDTVSSSENGSESETIEITVKIQ